MNFGNLKVTKANYDNKNIVDLYHTKTKKKPVAAKLKNRSFENVKCKSLSHQTRKTNTNSIQVAERNNNNGHFLM